MIHKVGSFEEKVEPFFTCFLCWREMVATGIGTFALF